MSEPIIKAQRLCYVRSEAPDLAVAQTFLAEFGLEVAERDGEAIYYRGSDGDPPCYVLTRGEGGFTTIAFEAGSHEDLEKIAAVPGASGIEQLEEPGGGEVVRLTDPAGIRVEIVHGRNGLDPREPAAAVPSNMDGARSRTGVLPDLPLGPSKVKRIGHLVIESADPDVLAAWYRAHLGLLRSDDIRLPSGEAQMLFHRLDRGQDYVDHHVVGFQFSMDEGARVQHVAWEVPNVDDLMKGHEHLKSKKRKHVWGVGRHRFGGQIFDYWKSPWGVIHEHWADTDLFNEDFEAREWGAKDVQDYWGPPPGPAFLVSKWNLKAVKNIVKVLRALR